TTPFPTFYPANRGYNVTQFYGISYSHLGDLLGGAQDNGTQYKDVNNPGTSAMEYKETGGGDGFDCALSNLNSNVQFSTVYTGATFRSSDKGASRGAFTSQEINDLPDGVKPFNNVIGLFETDNDLNSTDSVEYYATGNQAAGEVVMVNSKNLGVSFPHTLTAPLTAVIDDTLFVPLPNGGFDTSYTYISRDTIKIQDKSQTLFAQGLRGTGGVWVTRGALRFGTTPIWWKVLNSVGGDVTELEFSKDGNILYVGTSGGQVIRVKGFNNVYYDNTKNDLINGIADHDREAYEYADIRSGVSQLEITTIYSGTYVTGMGVDPNNPEHLVVTLAGYNAPTNILRSTTAASTTGTSSFTSIKGNMPTMPVYDAVIDMSDPTRMYAGTEFGAMVTLNSGATWSAQNDEMGVVPVYDVQQQYRDYSKSLNSGVVYFGTHGRGIWSSSDFMGIEEVLNSTEIPVTAINLYPNPVVNQTNINFELSKAADVTISVFSMNGQMISTQQLSNRQPGEIRHRINASDLPKGIYFVNVQAEGMKFKAAKFIKQ
ncbi:MAG: T9SS type A sorting domain-containing protein, partial [Flavobacteriales bacterium]